jgi:hypothetical protein
MRGPGNTSFDPAIHAEYGAPQALTWNKGTTGNTQSRLDNPRTSGATEA